MYPACPVRIVELCGTMFVVFLAPVFLGTQSWRRRRRGASLASIAGKADRPRCPLPELRAHRAGWRLPFPSDGLNDMRGEWNEFVLHGAVPFELAMRIRRIGSAACTCQKHEADAMCHQPDRLVCYARAPVAIMIFRVGLNRRPGGRRLRGFLSCRMLDARHGPVWRWLRRACGAERMRRSSKYTTSNYKAPPRPPS